jgi:hypothetical protein
MAVGDNQTPFGPRALAAVFDDNRWQRTVTPTLSGVLAAVSCPATRGCVAVGTRFWSSGRSVPLAEFWDGDWDLLSARDPAVRGEVGSTLSGVSCRSAWSCIAVGEAQTRSGALTLAERWDGTRWRVQRTTNVRHARASVLSNVSCAGRGACIAVGNYVSVAKKDSALVERWSGSSWRIQPTPSVGQGRASELSAVACPAPKMCVAVGSYGASPSMTLAETWDGTRWHLQSPPNPAHATASVLEGVSCPSSTHCIAVGYYRSSSGRYVTLIEMWNGTRWSIQRSPPERNSANLITVSCHRLRHCVAVGYLESGSGMRPLAVASSGPTWTTQSFPAR